jgi:hypothetical protein
MRVVVTLMRPHRHVLDYLAAASEAALCSEPAHPLLSTFDQVQEFMLPHALLDYIGEQ